MIYILTLFILVCFVPLAVSMTAVNKRSRYALIPYLIIFLDIAYLLVLNLLYSSPKLYSVLHAVYIVITLVFAVTFITFNIYNLFGLNITLPKKCDAIIVYGAALRGNIPSKILAQRLDKAYEILTAFPSSVCIVSGGKGDDEIISEAQCMSEYLIKRGIEPKRIIKEDKSTDTPENTINSKKILYSMGIKENIVAVSSDYHMKRIYKIGKDEKITLECVGVRTKGFLRLLTNSVREYLSLLKYYIEKFV